MNYLKTILCGGLCLAMLGAPAASAAGARTPAVRQNTAVTASRGSQRYNLEYKDGKLLMRVSRSHPSLNWIKKNGLTVLYAEYDRYHRLCSTREGCWNPQAGAWEFDVKEFPEKGSAACFFMETAASRPICESIRLSADRIKTDNTLDDENLGEWD